MSKVKVNLRLEPTTLGYLHYLMDVGETKSIYGLLNTLVLAYMEHYTEEKDLDLAEVTEEAIAIFNKTRRPQSDVTKKQQLENARKSVSRVKVKKNSSFDILGDVEIKPGSLKGNFE